MRISVFAIGADPATDAPFIRKSVSYCETEVATNRATMVDKSDIRRGIQLRSMVNGGFKHEARGSREQNGCLTAYEAQLNAECRSDTRSIGKLSQHYEIALENHILKGLKGMPRKCGVIAARVKTILSNPSHA